MSLSADEFNAFQQQLLKFKQENYDLREREKATLPELTQLRKKCRNQEVALVKYKAILTNNKQKELSVALMEENEALRQAVEMKTTALREAQEGQASSAVGLSDDVSGDVQRRLRDLQNQVRELEGENEALRKDLAVLEEQRAGASVLDMMGGGGAAAAADALPVGRGRSTSSTTEEVVTRVASTCADSLYSVWESCTEEADLREHVRVLAERVRELVVTNPAALRSTQAAAGSGDVSIASADDEDPFGEGTPLADLDVTAPETPSAPVRGPLEDALYAELTDRMDAMRVLVSRKSVPAFEESIREGGSSLQLGLSDDVTAAAEIAVRDQRHRDALDRKDREFALMKAELESDAEAVRAELVSERAKVDDLGRQVSARDATIVERTKTAETTQRNFDAVCRDLAETKKILTKCQTDLSSRSSSETKAKSDMTRLEESNKALTARVAELETQLASHDEELQNTTSETDELAQAYKESVEAVRVAKERIGQLEEEKRELEDKYAAEQAKRGEEHQARAAELEEQLGKLEAELVASRNETEAAEAATIAVRGELADATAAHEALEGSVSEMADDVVRLEAELEEARGEAASKQNKIAELQVAVARAAEEKAAAVAEADERVAALEERIGELETQLEDGEVERKIREKKSLHMVKELKAQLQREVKIREDAEQAIGSLNAELADTTAALDEASARAGGGGGGGGGGDSGGADASREHDGDGSFASGGDHSFASGGDGDGDEGTSSVAQFRREMEVLARRLKDQTAHVWRVEETNRNLEETVASMREDIAAKVHIIKDFIMKEHKWNSDQQGGRPRAASEHVEVILPPMPAVVPSGNDLVTQYNVAAEANAKLSTVLEDTILDNIRLKTTIKTLEDDVSNISQENSQLKDMIRQLDG